MAGGVLFGRGLYRGYWWARAWLEGSAGRVVTSVLLDAPVWLSLKPFGLFLRQSVNVVVLPDKY